MLPLPWFWQKAHHQISQVAGMCPTETVFSLSSYLKNPDAHSLLSDLDRKRPSLHLSAEKQHWQIHPDSTPGAATPSSATQGGPQVPVSWQVWKTVSFQPISLDIDILF